MSDFNTAVDNMSNKVNKTLSQDEMKEIYALYKQATVGNVNIPKPEGSDVIKVAKWEAWNGKKGISQDDAKKAYVNLAEKMMKKHGAKWN